MNKDKIKLLSVMLVAVFIILNFTFLSAYADSNTVTYEIPELAMTIDIPKSISVVTKETKQSNPLFSDGFDYIQTMSKLRDNNDFLYGKALSGSYDFELAAKESEEKIRNLSKLSQKKQESFLLDISKQSDIIESSFYKSHALVFVESSRSSGDSNGRFFTKEYYTIYQGMDIVIKLTSSGDNLSEAELNVLKGIVNSVRFPEERTVKISEELGKSDFFLFCLITISFIFLICCKIKEINKEKRRAERRKNRQQNNISAETSVDGDKEEFSGIDLEEAIANFENTSRNRGEQRESNKK